MPIRFTWLVAGRCATGPEYQLTSQGATTQAIDQLPTPACVSARPAFADKDDTLDRDRPCGTPVSCPAADRVICHQLGASLRALGRRRQPGLPRPCSPRGTRPVGD